MGEEYRNKIQTIVRNMKAGQIIRFVSGGFIKKQNVYHIEEFKIIKILDEAIDIDNELDRGWKQRFRTAIVEKIETTNNKNKKIDGASIYPYCCIVYEDGEPILKNKITASHKEGNEDD